MPYSKDILELKRHLLRAAESSNSYFDLTKLIVDVRKVNDSEIPYSGLGARSPNDYFPSIKIIGSKLRTPENDYTHYNNIDTTFTLGGRYSTNIITSDVPFFVSGMSYGSLKLPAKIALHLALNRLAKEGIRVIMNTGEGGALPWELYGSEESWSDVSKKRHDNILSYADRLLKEHHLDSTDRDNLFCRLYPLITQYASGRFWKDPSYLLNADGIEIKIGQVAKILELREITDWRTPIIVKVGCSRVYDDIEIILKSYADAASIDGFVGGTGAAPWELRDIIGINTIPSLKPAREAIENYYSTDKRDDDEFRLIVHGSVWDSERIAKCIALGANGVGIGTGFLLSMGCTLVQDCYTNACPAGLTGSYEKLDIQTSVNGIVNYVKGTLLELNNIAGSVGRKSIHDLRREDLVATDELTSMICGLPLVNGQTFKDSVKEMVKTVIDKRSEVV